jgi:CrcB protein
MLTTLMIGIAGGIGTLLRYGLSLAMTDMLGAAFPFGTLTVNLLGSFALSLIAEVFAGATFADADVRLLLGVGLMGGFTTYSSFNLEALRLLQQGAYPKAAGYIVATLLGCLVSGLCGLMLARALMGAQPPG